MEGKSQRKQHISKESANTAATPLLMAPVERCCRSAVQSTIMEQMHPRRSSQAGLQGKTPPPEGCSSSEVPTPCRRQGHGRRDNVALGDHIGEEDHSQESQQPRYLGQGLGTTDLWIQRLQALRRRPLRAPARHIVPVEMVSRALERAPKGTVRTSPLTRSFRRSIECPSLLHSGRG